jgi:hypothetical protein
MTADALVFLVALVLPIMTLAILVGLITGVAELERSRDELIELSASKR